ncbi:MAG: TIGR03960 family B12-binding radical SAM protein [Candidatus Saccharicenans sp.]|nr:TIGR03960 family B12-binding radical SAM protein [Candidatus Saccharicenans sp.]
MKTISSVDQQRLELLLRRVQKPGRYTGGEWNQIKKDPGQVKVRVALAFPEVYEIGLSYLGQKILYNLLNRRPDVLAERVYAPWPDFEGQLRQSGLPLYSLENKIPLHQFDIVGFSLLYELNYTNLLGILELGGIPVLARDREPGHPLVMAGGPAALNPEPLAEFIDIFALGDGEELIHEIIDRYLAVKDSTRDRQELIRSFAGIRGIYLPAFYQACAQPGSPLLVPRPQPGFPDKIEKRVVFPLDRAAPPDKFIVPNIQSVFDRLQVEVARGCPQNCRFCQAASLYFPYRLRPGEQAIQIAWQGLKTTGYDDLSFNALSVGDYPFLEKALDRLLPFLEKGKIAVSLPSLRPGRLSRKMVENIVRIRKTGFTLVPEAGSERLRRVINKKISDEELLTAARYAFENGWRLLKLYFMIGLPTETAEDLKAIIVLIGRLVEQGRKILGSSPAINLSVSSFIPKPHTPFQWVAMDDEKLLQQKQEYIRSNSGRWKKVELKEHRVKASILEAVFSRGDRRLGPVLNEAYRRGARFDGWLDQFNFDLWTEAFEKAGLDYTNYLKAIPLEAELPWDIVEIGLKKDYLKRELQAGLEGQYSDSCLERSCGDCQACDWPEYKATQEEAEKIQLASLPDDKEERASLPEPVRYRAFYQKSGPARFISHNDLLNHLERAFRRAGLKIAFSQGYHPKMLMTYGPALPLGLAARAEVMEFKALENIDEASFLPRINASLPEGLKFVALIRCRADCLPLFQDIKSLVYTLDLTDPELLSLSGLENQLSEESLKKLTVVYPDLIQIRPDPSGKKLWFFLEFNSQKPTRIQDVVETLLGLKDSVYLLTREYLVFSNGRDSRGSKD